MELYIKAACLFLTFHLGLVYLGRMHSKQGMTWIELAILSLASTVFITLQWLV